MKIIKKSPWENVGRFGVKRKRHITYRARFFESGKCVEKDCSDVLYDRGGGSFLFLNTAKNVSYYDSLLNGAIK